MATKSKLRWTNTIRDSYLERVMEFPLVTIQSDAHLKEAQQAIDALLAEGTLDRGEELYLDTLSDLVVTYEDEHHSIPPASDATMLRHLMDTKEATQAEVSREAGISKSTISEILAGKRPFSRRVVRKLAAYFGVEVEVLTANI